MSAPLTHVRDWLTGDDIPVRRITPGAETDVERWDALRCIALRLDGLDAEVAAMTQSRLTEQDVGEMKPANFMQLAGMAMSFFADPADLPPGLSK